MKSLLKLSLLLFIVSIVLSSCCEILPGGCPDDDEDDDGDISLICVPPFRADTSTVRMRMDLDEIPYETTANWLCKVPNLILDINQFWINGGAPGANNVVTLLLPMDVEEGTYPISKNSPYDLLFAPAAFGNSTFNVVAGQVTVLNRDEENRILEGTFEGVLANDIFRKVTITKGIFSVDF